MLWWNNPDDKKELENTLHLYCDHTVNPCVQCMFEKDYGQYCYEVFTRGRDMFNKSAQEWLSEK